MHDGFHQEGIIVGWLWNRLDETRLIFGYKIVRMKVSVKSIENNIFKNLSTIGRSDIGLYFLSNWSHISKFQHNRVYRLSEY